MMGDTDDIRLLLSVQRALLGQIPPSLRAVSVEIDGHLIRFRALFDGEPTEADMELLQEATTLVIADFPVPFTIDEQLLSVPVPQPMEHLARVVFIRHEPNEHPSV